MTGHTGDSNNAPKCGRCGAAFVVPEAVLRIDYANRGYPFSRGVVLCWACRRDLAAWLEKKPDTAEPLAAAMAAGRAGVLTDAARQVEPWDFVWVARKDVPGERGAVAGSTGHGGPYMVRWHDGTVTSEAMEDLVFAGSTEDD